MSFDGVPIVGVLYKPDVASVKAGTSMVTAQVIKVDQFVTWPLLKPNSIPSLFEQDDLLRLMVVARPLFSQS
jgi:hypothetical protein